MRDNRSTAQHLARAVQRTLVWMHAHTPDEIAAKTPKSLRGEDEGIYVDALKHSMPMFSLDGAMSADGARAVHTLLAGSMDKVRTIAIDLEKTYTNEFVSGR